MTQVEITEPADLLTPAGTLARRGWSRRPLLRYERAAVRAGWHRIKEWDYYCVLDRSTPGAEVGLAVTVADIGYLALLSATWVDFAARTERTVSTFGLLPRGRLRMPSSSATGDVVASGRGLRLAFRGERARRVLTVEAPGFAGGPLAAELTITRDPAAECVVVATPFAESERAFYYNEKVPCLAAEGVVRIGAREHRFAPASASAVLDWGRGVWPYRNRWFWASASGALDGAPFGFNLGAGFGDLSAATENAVLLAGRAHKLGRVAFEHDATDWLRPWRIRDDEGRLDAELSPVLDRASSLNLLALETRQHQVFGRWKGRAVLDDGRAVPLDGLAGFAEDVYNRW